MQDHLVLRAGPVSRHHVRRRQGALLAQPRRDHPAPQAVAHAGDILPLLLLQHPRHVYRPLPPLQVQGLRAELWHKEVLGPRPLLPLHQLRPQRLHSDAHPLTVPVQQPRAHVPHRPNHLQRHGRPEQEALALPDEEDRCPADERLRLADLVAPCPVRSGGPQKVQLQSLWRQNERQVGGLHPVRPDAPGGVPQQHRPRDRRAPRRAAVQHRGPWAERENSEPQGLGHSRWNVPPNRGPLPCPASAPRYPTIP